MAGAGYKLFNTGDVLTAAQVNTYLQEQTVMVFANSTARTTALSGVLAEGMVTYLKDTDAVEKYNGSAWVSIGGSASPLTTKGDLYTYSTTDARLAVGSNGDTLVADSSATTGLRWQGDWNTGKNKIINGDFNIWQRGAGAFTSDGIYSADRFNLALGGSGTLSVTRESFTPGTAPVAGYESQYFLQAVTASTSGTTDYKIVSQYVEDVRTFAGQTTTFSFWAKAASGTPKIAIEVFQNFGSGGSSSVFTYGGQVTLSTSWTRYSVTISIPSVSGKTIGASSFLGMRFWLSAGSDFNARTGSLGNQNGTFQIWGVQLEAGSVATPFTTATGTLAGELAACQRYYYMHANILNAPIGYGANYSATIANLYVKFPVTMRTTPTLSSVSGTDYYIMVRNGGSDNFNSFTLDIANNTGAIIYNNTEISGTAGNAGYFAVTNASGSVAFTSEL